ncbi:MAG TPA: C4-type zinc ribbon domain-containing protein [Candidatus Dormibacteraeota bacterium]|nr:C4-type zinc ribbon domain-containing protein [Candidatus Dormibacteraeota bacterium]
MNRAAEQLLELQHADDEVERLGREVAAVEGQIARDPELDAAREDAARKAEAQRQAELRVRSLDGELETLRTRARTLDRQLYGGSVRNPAELLTLQRELEEVKAQAAAQEDETLLAMEDADQLAEARAIAEKSVGALEARRGEQQGPLADRLRQLRQQHEEAVQARVDLAAQMPAASRALYDRVKARHQPAVVRVVQGTCGGCHLPLGAHEAREARVGDALVQCANCDRILAP